MRLSFEDMVEEIKKLGPSPVNLKEVRSSMTETLQKSIKASEIDPNFKYEISKMHGGEKADAMFPMWNLHFRLPSCEVQ